MWEIGKEINDGYFQIPDDKIKELPKRAYAQLCNDLFRQLPVFSKKAFSNQNVYLASRFAAIFQDISIPVYLSTLLTWPYLKVLLTLSDSRAIIFYATKAAREGLSVPGLKKEISQNSFKDSIEYTSTEPELLQGLVIKKEERKVIRKGRNSLIMDTILLDFTKIINSKLALNNIFKSPYIDFLSA